MLMILLYTPHWMFFVIIFQKYLIWNQQIINQHKNIKKIQIHGISYASKQVNIPNIEIKNIEIEFADKFIFLGLTIHKHLKWDSHINKIASKILNIIGIMYRLNTWFLLKLF